MATHYSEAPRRGAGNQIRWVIAALTLTALALTAWFAIALARAVPPPALDAGPAASVLRVPLPLPTFALTDHEGQRFDESRLAGHWSFLFFGYASCPDVCPVTLGNFRAVHDLVATGADSRELADVQFVFVSVDPERDTPERLGKFIPYFHPDFIGATGEPEELEPLTGALGIYHARAEGNSELDYLVDHTTSVMLIGPQGQLRAIFPAPHDPGAVAEAFQKIRRYGERG
jgi:protein SCO1/2